MPKKMDRCVRAVKRKLVKGKIKKTYLKRGKKLKTNPYAICKASMRRR